MNADDNEMVWSRELTLLCSVAGENTWIVLMESAEILPLFEQGGRFRGNARR